MDKKIKIRGLGRKNLSQLFATGSNRDEFYFISPPTNKIAKDFFDKIYERIKAGEQIEVEAAISGRNAQLVISSVLENSVQMAEKHQAAVQQYDDSVKAQIVQTDLYSIIHDAKEVSFASVGKHCNWNYEKKMEALMQGKPQERLAKDRLAREIVRMLLVTGVPTPITGMEGPKYSSDYVQFTNYSTEKVSKTVHELMNEDGLLDFTFQCHSPNSYAFECEFIVKPWNLNPAYMESQFILNQKLREALKEMLFPFVAEKPQYVLPQKEDRSKRLAWC